MSAAIFGAFWLSTLRPLPIRPTLALARFAVADLKLVALWNAALARTIVARELTPTDAFALTAAPPMARTFVAITTGTLANRAVQSFPCDLYKDLHIFMNNLGK